MRVVVHGNCQADAVADLLKRAKPDWKIEAFQVHLIDVIDGLFHFEQSVREADIILSQPISKTYRGCEKLSLAWVKAAAKPRAILITFPVIYFQGDHPLEHGLAVGPEYLSGYNFETWNLLLVEGFLAGKSRDSVIASALDPERFSYAALSRATAQSLDLLRERERRFEVDVVISPFISRNHNNIQLFHTVNHPHRPVIAYLVNQVFALLGYNSRIDLFGDDCMGWCHIPRPPYVQSREGDSTDRHEWKFLDADKYHLDNGEVVTQVEFLKRSWPLLENFDIEKLFHAFSAQKEHLEKLDDDTTISELYNNSRKICGVTSDINHILSYGQSLSNGWQGWPPLSIKPVADNLMLGKSVRPKNDPFSKWIPLGLAELQPLVAVGQCVQTGEIMDLKEAESLPDGAPKLGETILEGALNQWRMKTLSVFPDRLGKQRLLGSSCGIGGQALEALVSSGQYPYYYDRINDCSKIARGIVAKYGHTYGISALLMLQGEANNWGADGTSNFYEYKRILSKFYDDFVEDAMKNDTSEPKTQPAMFMYQTGGAYSSIENNIPQAQLEIGIEKFGCFLVSPIYFLTESDGGHLDSNGYRWLGAFFGKVLHRVVDLGQKWKPLYPLRAVINNHNIEIYFHVPVAPLVWQNPIAGHNRIEIKDMGFEVIDSAGAIDISDIKIFSENCVQICLARLAGENAYVRYAGANRLGRGCLRDSDNEIAHDKYCYLEENNNPLTVSIEELNDRPYPLHNWCVAFSIDLE